MVMKCMNFQYRVKFSVNMGEENIQLADKKQQHTGWKEKHQRQSKKN